MAGTKSQGTRVFYHATSSTVPTALAPGSYLATAWVEIARGVDVSNVPMKVENYDDSCLNDLQEIPRVFVKPGTIDFSREQDDQTVTLRGFCDGNTLKGFAVVYPDGNCDYAIGGGYLVCTSSGKASKGFANKINESYQIVSQGVITRVAHS